MDLDEMKEDAATWFGCDLEEVWFDCEDENGCQFSEPNGGQCVISEDGDILAVIDGVIQHEEEK